jgi:hypothetical protein
MASAAAANLQTTSLRISGRQIILTAAAFQHLVRNGIAWMSVLQKAGFQ